MAEGRQQQQRPPAQTEDMTIDNPQIPSAGRARQATSNAQDEAILAARAALDAQMAALEAIKTAFEKQLIAQEKSQRASQQVTAQGETANQVAMWAAREAAQKVAKVQKEVVEQQYNQRLVAQEAARHALAASPANAGFLHASSRQQLQPNWSPVSQPSSGVQIGNPRVFAGNTLKADSVPKTFSTGDGLQPSSPEQQAIVARNHLLTTASKAAAEAQTQMQAAKHLAANSQDFHTLQQANTAGTAAQRQMEFAQQMALATQSPDTTLQAFAALERG